MSTQIAIQPPFWADTFDLDLLKVVPDAPALLGELAPMEIRTHGHTDDNGRHTHPSVWNGYTGMVAFFGFRDPARPIAFHTEEPVVTCTVLEAFRDAWVHDYELNIERRRIWERPQLQGAFQDLLYHHRGWRLLGGGLLQERIEQVRQSLCQAYGRLSTLVLTLDTDRRR